MLCFLSRNQAKNAILCKKKGGKTLKITTWKVSNDSYLIIWSNLGDLCANVLTFIAKNPLELTPSKCMVLMQLLKH